MARKLIMVGTLLTAALFSSACSNHKCEKMRACCAAVVDAEWVGESCGELAQGVRDPETCQTITETIRHAFDEREEQAPAVCR